MTLQLGGGELLLQPTLTGSPNTWFLDGEGPAVLTELSVRITGDNASALWEGRAQIATGVKSPYSNVDTSARTLAAGLFRDFPGGNGETVTISVKKLQANK